MVQQSRKFILGKKKEMTQIWEDGKVIPCTVIEAGPCFVTQIKNQENDGYDAVQIGLEKKSKKIKKSEKGKEFKYLKEFRIDQSQANNYQVNQMIDVSIFQEGDKIKVSGTSKGKGFQGAVKRHHFRGHPQTHGVKHEVRTVGSVGPTNPDRVIPGKKMPGHMGFKRVTVRNLKIVKIDPENNLLVVKGAVPGPKGTLLEIRE